MNNPVEITKSLAKFREDHPDDKKCCFLMMKFGLTDAHESIVKCLDDILRDYDIELLRADKINYHADLYWNVMTYIYGCSFGIALFERIESEVFNPNVAFELGYMFALDKPVCLLKDRTLPALPTDVMGKYFVEFDTQQPNNSIGDRLTQWLMDKNLIERNNTNQQKWKWKPNPISSKERMDLKIIEFAAQGKSNAEIAKILDTTTYYVYTVLHIKGFLTSRRYGNNY
jgi:hypothetical protein